MAIRHNPIGRPRLACEIMPDRVIAARASDDGARLEVAASRRLAAGTISPSLTAGNVGEPTALRDALGAALEAIAGRLRDVTVIIPDVAVRVTLMDFDVLPARQSEVLPLMRFRLRKSLPFDVEKAALSYHAWPANGTTRVLVAVAPHAVIEEYELALRDAGFSPGVVLPSILATLGVVRSDVPTLVLKLDPEATGMAIVDGEEIRLLRNLEHSGAPMTTEELVSNVYPSIVFYEDTYGARIERLLVGGAAAGPDVTGALAEHTGIRAEELMPSGLPSGSLGDGAPNILLAGVAGALIS